MAEGTVRAAKTSTAVAPSASRPGAGLALLGLACGLSVGAFLLGRSPEPAGGDGGTETRAAPTGEVGKLPAMPVGEPGGWLDATMQTVDSLKTDWDTEAFQVAADNQLKIIAKLLTHPRDLDEAHLSKVVHSGFASRWLRAPQTDAAVSDRAFVVRRARDGITPPAEARGPGGFGAMLLDLLEVFKGASDLKPEFKTYKVELGAGSARTVAIVEISGTIPAGRVQVNCLWRCEWRHTGRGSAPMLAAVESVNYEEVVGAGPRMLEDCTESVLGANPSYRGELLYSLDHWRSRIETGFGIDPTGLNGLAIGDVNDDGLEDLYLCRPGALPNKLFLRNPDGTLRDASAGSGVDILDRTAAALIIDLDNDGKADMVIAAGSQVVFFQGDGTGRFTAKHQVPTQGGAYSLAAADYDQDGLLDVYICCNELAGLSQKDLSSAGIPSPFHDAQNGAPNILIRNLGGWKFEDVTVAVGLDVNNRRYSYAAAWEDFDNDGRLDLCVASDFGRKNLYRNLGGRFEDVTAAAGAGDRGAGMSVTWADIDNTGWMSVYFGNMFSKAGNRIAFQQRFKEADEKTIGDLRRFSRGNTLLTNNGDGTFRDDTDSAGVWLGRWAWSSNFADINNDGLPDILVANGYLTTDDPGDL